MNVVITIVILLTGFILGVIISAIALYENSDGDVIVTWDDQGEGPYLFLELEESPYKLEHKKTAVFRVVAKKK
jgi:hypothetical protein